MDKKGKIMSFLLAGFLSIALLVSACSPGQFLGPTLTPSPTITSTSSPLPSPTETPTPTDTPPPPTATLTPTPAPQTLVLRRKCGRDYMIQPNEPIQIVYGGWGVLGKELADEWTTSLEVVMRIDGEVISGELQPPANTLPHNCTTDRADLYWLYYIASIPGLAPGEHPVSMKFSALRALPDGTGLTFGPGPILEQSFNLIIR